MHTTKIKPMNKAPSIQWYPDKWLADTRRLSWKAKGIYIDLLNVIWMQFQETCSIPDDADLISAELGCSKEDWLNARSEIMLMHRPLLEEKNQKLTSFGLKKEREKQKKFRQQCSRAGKASSTKRLHNQPVFNVGSTSVQPEGQPNTQPEVNTPTPTPTPTPSSLILTHTHTGGRWIQPLSILKSSGKLDSLTEESLGLLNQSHPGLLDRPEVCEGIRVEACTVVGGIESPMPWLRRKLSDVEKKSFARDNGGCKKPLSIWELEKQKALISEKLKSGRYFGEDCKALRKQMAEIKSQMVGK